MLLKLRSTSSGTTWIYVYNRGGNILSKAAYAYTTGTVGTAVRTWLYEYNDANWKDKLTKFDGNTITHDAIGNPLNDGTWTCTWQAGRQLKSMSKVEDSDTITMEFTYNHAGLRTKKVRKINGVVAETTEYILNGKNVVELIHTDNTTGTTPTVNRLHFYYDAQGRVTMVDFNGTLYSYAHNLQGDIIGILDNSGNLVVEYRYDAWGKPTATTASGTLTTTLGELSPFRYRGYVWDDNTLLYYLINRYYSVSVHQFLNVDKGLTIRAKYGSVWTYCYNNPVCFEDNNGDDPWWMIIPDWGYIHRQVQAHLSEKNYEREVWVIYYDDEEQTMKRGRIDLLAFDGSAIEVKPDNQRAIDKGKSQLKNYISGVLEKPDTISSDAHLHRSDLIIHESFDTEDGRFKVKIDSDGDGIIRYSFSANNPNTPQSLFYQALSFMILNAYIDSMESQDEVLDNNVTHHSSFGGGHSSGGGAVRRR